MSNRFSEKTTKESFIGIDGDHFKTEVSDKTTGNKGVGLDYEKDKSIEKAWDDLHGKQGR